MTPKEQRLANLAKSLKLTDRQRTFAETLASNGGNQRQAAIAAGSPPRSADVTGSKWASHGKVVQYLKVLRAEAERREERAIEKAADDAIMRRNELLRRLSAQARADIGKHLRIVDGRGEVYLDQEHTDVLRDVVVKEGPKLEDGTPAWTETRIKVADPVPALTTMARIYGLEKVPTGPQVQTNVLVQVLAQSGVDVDRLRDAGKGMLREE